MIRKSDEDIIEGLIKKVIKDFDRNKNKRFSMTYNQLFRIVLAITSAVVSRRNFSRFVLPKSTFNDFEKEEAF